ncbi:MAG TPA: NUDIX hydrolase [Streptosporangiaceae bacterium]|nr:NUDIX hydrolase [Streptosporangiaceae bacterium]
MDTPADIDVRCSAIVFRGNAVLLVHRAGAGDWVLPGGTPRPGESMAACARRETLEEAGLAIDPARVAFIAETLAPGSARRAVDLVFLAAPDVRGDPLPSEPGLEARFVPLTALPRLDVRPPLAGHLRALHARGSEPTAAYLGNLWRPQRHDGTGAARLEAAGEPAGGGLP